MFLVPQSKNALASASDMPEFVGRRASDILDWTGDLN